ncbi:MAG: hypothetical protein EA382_05045 [Spirochaetaceae bacterium]|nr:MAG: hypothetical protein EA382_05045 [Spirochaetaceae bacterium]
MKESREGGIMNYYEPNASGVSSPADRAALFDSMVDRIMSRDAFVPVKLQRLGVDVRRALLACRDEVIAADSDEKLIYALLKASCARKDPHVRVHLVTGGLQLSGAPVDRASVRIDQLPASQAPIRFAVDYSGVDPASMHGPAFAPGRSVFVADYAPSLVALRGGSAPAIGDRLIAVNGQPFDDYLCCVEPYSRYATANGFWWRMAAKIPVRSREYPPHFFDDTATFTLEHRDGRIYDLTLPYKPTIDKREWTGTWKEFGDFRYPGFTKVHESATYQLYAHDAGRPVVVIDFHKFGATLIEDTDALVAYAEANGLLGHAVVFDATRAGGGSLGAYAIRHLSPKPFRTTFGNLRISDVVEPFAEEMRARRDARLPMTAEDDGSWLVDWLDTDVAKAVRCRDHYSNDVPFKSSHLPRDSDGVLQPAPLHFSGPMVCLLGPHGGSHLDQFAAMIADNGLAHIVGMPAGGYSNTWEWEETLHFPICRLPTVKLMYSMGHTIRPNGQLLEGNPADADEFVPLTRDNYVGYHELLLERAMRHLGL